MRHRGCAWGVLVAGFGLATLHAQPPAQDRPIFRGGISLVEVSAVVTDDGQLPIADLTADDFEVFEDGERRSIASVRYLSTTPRLEPPPALPPSLAGARVDEVSTNQGLADASAFVLLLDDLNVSPYDAHRAIRAGLGVLGALPPDSLVSVLTTSGDGGSLLTLGRPSPTHVERVKAFRGQFLLTGPPPNAHAPQTTPSSVDAPCGVGSAVEHSPDCADPTRAARRAGALRAIGEVFSRTGSRRKVLLWLTTDMGVSPLDPKGNQQAQYAALQRLLGGDVTVYAIDPRENDAPVPGPSGQPSSMGRPDGRGGGRVRVGTADTTFQGLGGNAMMLGTDDMVGVPLTQLARDTGGRWIQHANNIETMAAEVVSQNLSSYVLAYESSASTTPGRHRIEVKVKRRGARVSARRAFIVPPPTSTTTVPDNPITDTTTRLAEVVRGGVPFGTLGLQAHVAPQFAPDGRVRALVTVALDTERLGAGDRVDLLVLAATDAGEVTATERLSMAPAPPGVRREGSVVLTVPQGRAQLRIAAITPDAAHSGLLLRDLDLHAPSKPVWLGVPTLLAEDAQGVRPTLARTFAAGHPLAFQVEVGGQALTRGAPAVRARLTDAAGRDLVAHDAVIEAGTSATQMRATGVVPTSEVPAGAYLLVVEARAGASDVARHVVPVRVEGASRAAAAATAARTLAPRSVAHGPLTRDTRRGGVVIRTADEWQAFWTHLPTRQAPPDIDFDRVVLLAVISDADGPAPATPRIDAIRTEPGGIVVEWTAVVAPPSLASPPPMRPFIVVGLTDVAGHVRFVRKEP